MRVSASVAIAMICIAGMGSCAQAAPMVAIDTLLVRSMDVTGDGTPDTISLHLAAKDLMSPFSWQLFIRSEGSVICSYSGDDSRIDMLFHDEGYVSGCKGYSECKRKYYFHDILNDLEERYSLEGILDRAHSNTLYRVGGAYLYSCCAITGAAANAILAAMEERLRDGEAVVISVPTSPVTSGPPMMYAPEVNRFVPIYEE